MGFMMNAMIIIRKTNKRARDVMMSMIMEKKEKKSL